MTCAIQFPVNAVLLVLIVAAPASAQEWSRFRGPNGSGAGQGDKFPVRWTDKEHLWKVKLPGIGHASPVLWNDRIFITSADQKAGKRFLSCLKRQTGATLWSRSWPAEKIRQHEHNSWASATPALDDSRVYWCWAGPKDFVALALDHDGNEKWRVDLGAFQSGHGFGVSPIVHEGLVILPHEHEGTSSVIALDRDTGKIRWRAPRRSKTTYSTPCIFQPAGRPAELILASYEHGLTSLDPGSGKLNWEIDVFDKRHVETSIASPIVHGDMVIGCSGWLGVRKEVIAVRPPSPGEKPRVVYRLMKGMPLVPTPIVANGLMFLWEDEGIVTCADPDTGKVHWQERVEGSYYSSPIAAGGHLYNVTRDGEVVVLRAARELDIAARIPLGEGSHSTPAVAGNTLFFRTFHHLLAIGK